MWSLCGNTWNLSEDRQEQRKNLCRAAVCSKCFVHKDLRNAVTKAQENGMIGRSEASLKNSALDKIRINFPGRIRLIKKISL
jgi:hypothetical protein